jgi:hypothetical protein
MTSICMWIARIILCFVLCGPAWAQTTRPAKLDGRDILRRSAQAYSQVTAAEIDGVFTFEYHIGGKQETGREEYTARLMAPNYFHMKIDQGPTIGSTGTIAYIHQHAENVFIQRPPPEARVKRSKWPMEIRSILQTRNPSLLLMMQKDPLKDVIDGPARIDRLDDEDLDGRRMYVLAMASGPESPRLMVLIDQETYFVRRITTDLSVALRHRGLPNVQRARTTVDYPLVRTDVTFEPADFAWSPPSGAKDITPATKPATSPAAGEN